MTNEAKGVRFYQKRGTCLTIVSFLNMIPQIMLELSIPCMYAIINFVGIYTSYLNVAFFFFFFSVHLLSCFHGPCSLLPGSMVYVPTQLCQIRLMMYMMLSTSCSYGKS